MYPSESLTVITPIVFFVLLLGFPLIGVFAGWKRAAYWGGGNLLFYIIGLIVWKCGWSGISQAFTNLLISILGDKIKGLDFSVLLHSVIAPLFFVIVMLIGNIILVICYYTFAKRLMQIGKYDDRKNAQLAQALDKKKQKEQQAKKEQQHKGSSTKVKVQAQKSKSSVANAQWFNRLVGGVGLTALMLPITLTTTHLVTIVTTDTETRQSNSFTKGMYEGLQSLSSNMDWFSYYDYDVTGRDYDGLFNIIDMYSVAITYKDAFGKEQINNSVKALSDLLNQGFNNLINKTLDPNITVQTKEAIEPMVTALNNFVNAWDSITSQCQKYVVVILNSPGIITLLDGLIATAKGSIKISDEEITQRIAQTNSIFNIVKQAYINGKLIVGQYEFIINQAQNVIQVSKDAFEMLSETIYSLYDVSQITEENKQILKEKTQEQIQLFFSTII